MMAMIALVAQAALRALVAAVAVWGGLRLLRVTNVVVEKMVWALVLAAALALPLLPAGFGRSTTWEGCVTAAASGGWTRMCQWADAWGTRRSSAQSRGAVSAMVAEAVPAAQDRPLTTTAGSALALPAEESRSAAVRVQTSTPPASLSRPMAVRGSGPGVALAKLAAQWIYLGVALALLLRLAFGLAGALRLWRSSRPIEAGLAEGLRVRASRRLQAPVTVGSTVLLPVSYAEWSREKLSMALAHERSHIRQGDFYLQIAAAMYAALVWPSPLGWWLRRRLSELGEAIGDRAALDVAPDRASYARLLLEFAALPRPTRLGVAMAHTSRLSSRIERLLNESSFSKAFARKRGALAALVVVPAALMASTALVHVYAATPAGQQAQTAAEETAAPTAEPGMQPPPPPMMMMGEGNQQQPPMPPPPGMMPPPPGQMQGAGPGAAGQPGQPGQPDQPGQMGQPGPMGGMAFGGPMKEHGPKGNFPEFGQPFGPAGEPYALIGDKPGQGGNFRGWIAPDDLAKARKLTHGNFLWFRHDGKSYIVDDAALVAQLEASNANFEEMGKKMRAAGEQMRQQVRPVDVKVPDLTKEMESINKALATLKAKQGATISPKELGEITRQLGELQRRLGEAQFGKIPPMPEMGKQGEEMRKLGEQMQQSLHQNEEKIRAAIAESLKDGKAKEVK